jgi:hypothetical protein
LAISGLLKAEDIKHFLLFSTSLLVDLMAAKVKRGEVPPAEAATR